MAWDSVGKSLGSVVEERLSNPLISSFLIAWCAINWKFFVILFSKNSVTDTFALIQQHCFPNLTTTLIRNLAAPLTFSIAYVVIILPFSLLFFKSWKRAQAAIDEVRDQYDREQRLTLEKSQELRRKNAQLEGENDELKEAIRVGKADLRAATAQIEDLQGDDKLSAEIREINKQLQDGITAARKEADDASQKYDLAKRAGDQREAENATLKKQLEAERSKIPSVKGQPSAAMLAALFPAASAKQIEAMVDIFRGEPSNKLLDLLKQHPPGAK